jgi:tetratricopeptide (TPR) repeat protein
LIVAALCCWAIWQPLRSDRESDRALDLAANGHVTEARKAVANAHEIDPLSPRPYVVRNAIEDAAGNPVAAQKALEDAVLAFPADPQTWIQLAQYQLNARNMPAEALKTVVGALYLDPQSRAAQTVYFQADAAINGGTAPIPPPAPPATAIPAPTPTPTTPVPTAPAPPVTPSPKPNSGGTPAPGG